MNGVWERSTGFCPPNRSQISTIGSRSFQQHIQHNLLMVQENTQQQIQNTMAYTMTVILNEVWECEADLLLDPELNRTMEFSANMKEGFP